MKSWYLSSELVSVAGMPSSMTGVSQKARRSSWRSREVGGATRAMEFHVGSFPPAVQEALYFQYRTDADIEEYGDDWLSCIRDCDDGDFSFIGRAGEVNQPVLRELSLLDASVVLGVDSVEVNDVETLTLPEWLVDARSLDDLFVYRSSDVEMFPTVIKGDLVLMRSINDNAVVSDGLYLIRLRSTVGVARLCWDSVRRGYEMSYDARPMVPMFIPSSAKGYFKIFAKVIRLISREVV
ncbi:DNA-binding protein [Vibrio barjaei]|uniref:DNA-binding protein n=1 Tax=Vibrio barjaei TaxID=1676683 RepID=UPI00228373C9|nr:DNA-binding protein [Vibrio barjaei]MCY9874068.1 DNA-binding protein [Vibrio barjaei]